ncbi:MAG TPA: hypothetical protein VN725_06320 [Rhodanobacteraceae bacterium]|nr:hypothetical protein [Rhodanobacteraceae bacterium]
MAAFNRAVYAALKSDDVYIVLDHVAAPGSPANVTDTLHRIEPSVVRRDDTSPPKNCGCERTRVNGNASGGTEQSTLHRRNAGPKKRLEDYPDRVAPNLVMHEPRVLPFGGTYTGLADFQRFYGKVREYYDFETWQLIDVVGDDEIVFSTSQVRVARRDTMMYIAARFRFSGTTLVEVRVFICDASTSQNNQ